ncbi:hypothetical protein B0H66DRAFT_40617 [Apodospora peruviana]|uniref:Uncharacterized protein n=1 Tax=Apodospora peruviana TaxID=516989 RepID=A0AAE0IRC0_9PEZI|nr:hypothetical protein B0H66DRAFT_40617 [Apodospora peruviana]
MGILLPRTTCYLPFSQTDETLHFDPGTGLPADWFNGNCGNSAHVAREKKCRFSLVLHAWLPPEALSEADAADEKLMHRGRDADWPWELENGTKVTLEDVGRGEFSHVYTAAGWHPVHCAYVWKRLHRTLVVRAGEQMKMIDAYTGSLKHMEHCVGILSGGKKHGHDNGEDSRSVVYAKFPRCAYI